MDTSDRIGAAGTARKTARAGNEIIEAGEGPAVDPPAYSLKFRGTLFGSTLSRVFTALDGVSLGQEVAITTNDP